MGLTEFRFFFFAGGVVLLYYVLPKKLQWIVLLMASIVFYATYGLEKLPLILASSLIAYFAAQRMEEIRREERNTTAAKTRCKHVLLFSAVILVALLLYAKIGAWVIQNISNLLSREQGNTVQVIVALGVSYYTFSLISYMADVYRKKDKAEKNYFRFLLYVMYFPKILQGPISRHDYLAPQLKEEHRFDYNQFCFGLQLMVWGYFKKLVIADRLAIFINKVFGNIANETGAHLLVAACFATFHLYCDFSGCMDIVGGFSQCLGLELEKNFNHPFFSKTAAEFWRRWHITLGTWFKDYVLMPLMISPKLIAIGKKLRARFGPRVGKTFMNVAPLIIVWLLTGLWHGTSWNYVVWGMYWGSMIICSTVFAPEIKHITKLLRINTEAGSWKIFQMVRTYMLYIVSRILTSLSTLEQFFDMWKQVLFNFHPEGFFDGSLYTLGLNRPNFILALVCLFVLWCVSMLQERGSVREKIAESNIVFRWAIYYIAFFSILVFGIYGPGYDAAAFVYLQF